MGLLALHIDPSLCYLCYISNKKEADMLVILLLICGRALLWILFPQRYIKKN